MTVARRLARALPPPAVAVLREAADRVVPARRRDRRAHRDLLAARHRVDLLVREATGRTVAAGPFAGLRLAERASWGGTLAPYLVGSQEEELRDVIEQLVDRRPSRVLDIGCAEGYYAVGLARRLPGAEVYAYDIDPVARAVCGEAAALNGVAGRVHVRGECTWAELEALGGPDSLVVADCEGAELDLLDPCRAPELARTTVLVELHDFVDPAITATILGRFAPTHHATLVTSRERNPADYPVLSTFSAEDRRLAVDEMRPVEPHPMQWALLVPAGSPALPRRPAAGPNPS